MNMAMHNKNRGIVLGGVLIILISLTLVALTVAQRNTMDEKMAANRRDALNAMTISESGIEAGFALVKHNYIQGQAMTDELYELPGNVLSQDSVSAGSYLVTVIDGIPNDGKATLNSVGNFNGGVREIEIVLGMSRPGRGAYAILTSDSINSIDGSATVTGPHADVHSNSDVDIGNLVGGGIDGAVSASGSVTAHNSDQVTGGTVSGAAAVEIPHVYPPDYLQYATVILTADCKVMSPGGVEWANIPGEDEFWRGWKCKPDSYWEMSSNNPADGHFHGFYYVEGNVEIGASPDPEWAVTIVAEGYINVSGNPVLAAWGSVQPNDTGDAEANEILFLAGNDIKMRGTTSMSLAGIIAAHMEVSLSGNVQIIGSILAENGLHGMGQEVMTGHAYRDIASENDLTGNLTINGTGTGLGAIKQLTALAWRELIH